MSDAAYVERLGRGEAGLDAISRLRPGFAYVVGQVTTKAATENESSEGKLVVIGLVNDGRGFELSEDGTMLHSPAPKTIKSKASAELTMWTEDHERWNIENRETGLFVSNCSPGNATAYYEKRVADYYHPGIADWHERTPHMGAPRLSARILTGSRLHQLSSGLLVHSDTHWHHRTGDHSEYDLDMKRLIPKGTRIRSLNTGWSMRLQGMKFPSEVNFEGFEAEEIAVKLDKRLNPPNTDSRLSMSIAVQVFDPQTRELEHAIVNP